MRRTALLILLACIICTLPSVALCRRSKLLISGNHCKQHPQSSRLCPPDRPPTDYERGVTRARLGFVANRIYRFVEVPERPHEAPQVVSEAEKGVAKVVDRGAALKEFYQLILDMPSIIKARAKKFGDRILPESLERAEKLTREFLEGASLQLASVSHDHPNPMMFIQSPFGVIAGMVVRSYAGMIPQLVGGGKSACFGHDSRFGPSAALHPSGLSLLTWVGKNDKRINVASVLRSGRIDLRNHKIGGVEWIAGDQPAICAHAGGRVYVVFGAEEGGQLFVGRVTIGEGGEGEWRMTMPAAVEGAKTPSSPSVVSFRNRLFIAYRTHDGGCSLAAIDVSEHPETHDAIITGVDISAAEHVYSNSGPSLGVIGNRLFLSWTSSEQGGQLRFVTTMDGLTWSLPLNFGSESSPSTPKLVEFAGLALLVWQGGDARINVLSVKSEHAFAMESWAKGSKETSFDSTWRSPGVGVGEGKVLVAWTGTDEAMTLNSASFFDPSMRWRVILYEFAALFASLDWSKLFCTISHGR